MLGFACGCLSFEVNWILPVGVRMRFNLVRTLIYPLSDDILFPFISPVLMEWLHLHEVYFSQRLEFFGVLIEVPRLLSFADS